MGSKNYKIFWSQIWKPKWDSNNNKIKEKLCEMLNCIEIYYIPVEDDLNIEPECLESTLGLNLFNSEDDLVSKFMNENDFGPFLQSNKKFQTNYIKDRRPSLYNQLISEEITYEDWTYPVPPKPIYENWNKKKK